MTASAFLIFSLSILAGLVVVLLYVALLSRHRKAGSKEINLMGTIGSASTAIEPEGAVMLRGEMWRARVANDCPPILPGQAVRVIGARDHLLEVEPVD
jgi:membrane protein implicated in regulation of membrane protease activity